MGLEQFIANVVVAALNRSYYENKRTFEGDLNTFLKLDRFAYAGPPRGFVSYDPSKVTVTFNGKVISGFADGSKISYP